MSRFEVSAEIEIAAEPTDVAGVMFDPHRETDWLSVVESVDVLDKGIKPGARVRHTLILGDQRMALTTEVAQFQFPHALLLRFAEGPLEGDLAYHVLRIGSGSLARVRGRLAGDGAEAAERLQASLAGDLGRLKSIVERGAAS